MRLLIGLAVLIAAAPLLAAAGCSGGGSSDDGKNNPSATRISDAEFEAKRAKKGGSDTR